LIDYITIKCFSWNENTFTPTRPIQIKSFLFPLGIDSCTLNNQSLKTEMEIQVNTLNFYPQTKLSLTIKVSHPKGIKYFQFVDDYNHIISGFLCRLVARMTDVDLNIVNLLKKFMMSGTLVNL